MKEKAILKLVQDYIQIAETSLQQSEEAYEDGNRDGVARYHYWDGARDIALAIERAIKAL